MKVRNSLPAAVFLTVVCVGAAAQEPAWTHSDVYETTVNEGDVQYHCTITAKPAELQVTVESKTAASTGVAADGDRVVFEGHLQRFTVTLSPDGVVRLGPSVWTNFAEFRSGGRHAGIVRSGPSAQATLRPLNAALAKLPPALAAVFKKIADLKDGAEH